MPKKKKAPKKTAEEIQKCAPHAVPPTPSAYAHVPGGARRDQELMQKAQEIAEANAAAATKEAEEKKKRAPSPRAPPPPALL